MLQLTFDVNELLYYSKLVHIEFKEKKLRKICDSDRELQKSYGKNGACKIRSRLDDLQAASSLEVMRNLPGRCHELTADRKGQLSLDVEQPYRLIFEPWGDGVQTKVDGGLDWRSVKAVRILEIHDPH